MSLSHCQTCFNKVNDLIVHDIVGLASVADACENMKCEPILSQFLIRLNVHIVKMDLVIAYIDLQGLSITLDLHYSIYDSFLVKIPVCCHLTGSNNMENYFALWGRCFTGSRIQ